jgi:hypothetical protein
MHYSQSPPLAEALDLDAISDRRNGERTVRPAIHSTRASGLREDRVVSNRLPAGRRMVRSLTRFVVAVLIGVGATLSWQSYGDEARKIVAARAPTLARLLPVSTMKSPNAAAISPDPTQLLERSALNLDAVRRSVEQLAAKQDQMAQNIATLQSVEEEIKQKVSPAPPSQQTAPITQSKPSQPRAQPPAAQSSSASRPPPPAGPLVLTR